MIDTAKKINWGDLLMILALYLMLSAFHGYRFGDEDMMESLSYANFLLDNTLYPNDPYIQAVAESNWNERFPFASFLAVGGKNPAWYCFIIHLLSTLAFIWASLLIARKYIHQPFWQIIFIILFLFVTYHINLGENEAWYNYMMPSYLAKSLAIWAIYFFISNRINIAFGFLIVSTFAHPIVSAQLALIFGLIWMYEAFQSGWTKTKGWKGIIAYGLISGSWISIIFYKHLIADQSVSDDVFYTIMETRLAHHFFPSHYPMKSWLLMVPLMFGGLLFWRRINEIKLFAFYTICFVGMLVYLIGIEVLEIPQLLSLQWFKTTVWLKPLSLLALCAWLSSWKIRIHPHVVPILLVLGVIVAFAQFATNKIVGDQKAYHFPFLNFESDEIKMSKELKKELPLDATLLIPPNLTAVRYWSERSLYIDYKSNIHSRSYMSEADRRRRLLYGMQIRWREENKHMVNHGLSYYNQLSEIALKQFKLEGATHIMTGKERALSSFKKVAENESFVVYQL